ncbi:MAG: nucleotide exchange factor GrpE [Ignavibacteriales bacterium]
MVDPEAKNGDKHDIAGEGANGAAGGGPATVTGADASAGASAGAGTSGEAGVAGENARLREEIASLKRKADENWDLFLRSRADLDNYRKRTERDIAMMVRMGKRDLLLKLVEIADNFQRALAASTADAASLKSGLEMLSRQLDGVLDAEGVKPIPAVGEKFNPALHEAIATWVSQDVKDDTVTDEIQRGYTYQGDVLRVARVRVAQPAAGTQPVGGTQPAAGQPASQPARSQATAQSASDEPE